MGFRPLQEPKEYWRTLTKKLNDAFEQVHDFAGTLSGKVQKSIEAVDGKAQLKNDLSDAEILPDLVYGVDSEGVRGFKPDIKIHQSPTPPAEPINKQLWIDTSSTPYIFKSYNASTETWDIIGAVEGAAGELHRSIDFTLSWTPEALEGEKIQHYRVVVTKNNNPETAGALIDAFSGESGDRPRFKVFSGVEMADWPAGGVHPNWDGLKARFLVPEDTEWAQGEYFKFYRPWNETDKEWGWWRYEGSIII